MDEAQKKQAQADYVLAQRFLAGNNRAIAELADRLGCISRMLRTINRRLGDQLSSHDLEDLAQLIAVTVLGKLSSFRAIVGLEAWIYRIAYLQYLNAARSNWRKLRREQEFLQQESLRTESAPSPQQEEASAHEVELLESCMEELDEAIAEIIRMKHYDDLSFTEIGGALSISPNTIKSRYYKGIEVLQQKLNARIAQGGAR